MEKTKTVTIASLPHDAVYKRGDGSIWMKVTQLSHARAKQVGRFREWQTIEGGLPISEEEAQEEVEVLPRN